MKLSTESEKWRYARNSDENASTNEKSTFEVNVTSYDPIKNIADEIKKNQLTSD